MSYKLSEALFDDYLKTLSASFNVYGPVRRRGKGKFAETDVIGYGVVNRLQDLVNDEKSYFSPKETLYPIRETLFYFLEGKTEVPAIDDKPSVIFLRPCDINGIRKLDTIFLKNGHTTDYYYERRRKKVKFILLECTEGFDTCFCVSMNSHRTEDYDAAVRFDAEGIHLKIVDPALENAVLNHCAHSAFEPQFIEQNKIQIEFPAVDQVTNAHFDNPLWTEYTSRCIACGRCNTSCITCACFTMQDVALSDDKRVGERRRVWASCHVEGFTDMAGGHSFRNKNGEKMRFKTLHKINDFHKRFGTHMCVGCGRCDAVCPEYISFSKCIQKLSDVVKEERTHD